MRLRLSLAAAAAFACAAAPPADAATPRWSAPFTVFTQATGAATTALDGRGGALFTATGPDGVEVRSRSAAGVLSAVEGLEAPPATRFYTFPQAALNARGNAVVVWTQRDRATEERSSQIRTYAARRGAAARTFAEALRVEPTAAERAGDPRVAIDPRGRTFVTYDDFGADVSRALATVAPLGKRFAAPTPLFTSPDTGRRPDVAVGYGSRASVAIVRQRFTPRSDGQTQIQGDLNVLNASSGTGFGGLANVVRTDRMDTARRPAFGPPAIAVGQDGTTAVAYTQPRGGACLRGTCHDLYAAIRPAGARSFLDPVRVPSAGGYQGEQPALVVDQGEAIVAWHERSQAGTTVVSATLKQDATVSVPAVLGTDLLRSIDERPALALDGRGSVLAAWISPGARSTEGTPSFAIRPRDLPFSRPVAVRRARAARSIAAAGGRGGHAALAWLEDRGGSRPFERAAVVGQVRAP